MAVMNKHQLNALEVAKIKYKFQRNQFDYKLSIAGVDLDFLALRRAEVVAHMQTLKEAVSSIDFTDLQGAEDFHTADHMVRWYQDALRTINTQGYIIELNGKPYNPNDCSKAHAEYMYHATREKAI